MNLTPADSTRLAQHMAEDKQNPIAQASYQRGRDVMSKAKCQACGGYSTDWYPCRACDYASAPVTPAKIARHPDT